MAVNLAAPDALTPVAGVRLAAVAAGVRKPDRDDVVLLELAPAAGWRRYSHKTLSAPRP
nr:hypothetical protein [Immundisolibacter cernigliae]